MVGFPPRSSSTDFSDDVFIVLLLPPDRQQFNHIVKADFCFRQTTMRQAAIRMPAEFRERNVISNRCWMAHNVMHVYQPTGFDDLLGSVATFG
jgi:hypothetical protein